MPSNYVAYSAVRTAREEWVLGSGLACVAEDTLGDVVTISIEDERDLVTYCGCD